MKGHRIQGAPLQLCSRALEELRTHLPEDNSKHQVLEIGIAFYKKASQPLCLHDVPHCEALIKATHRELAHPPPDCAALNAIVRVYRKGGDITPHVDREMFTDTIFGCCLHQTSTCHLT